MFEEKTAFSEADFYQPVFNEIQTELNTRITNACNLTNIGRKKEELKKLHDEVLLELKEYADYCYTCIPPKKKKSKKK